MAKESDIRRSDWLHNGNGRLSMVKFAAVIAVCAGLATGGAAVAKHWFHPDENTKRIDTIEKTQNQDHDTLIRVETTVEQIKTEQQTVREDVRYIREKLENGN